MLKGLALTPPVIGRISIGRIIEKNGKRLPEKDDEFTLTSQVQSKEGWVPHPLDACLRQNTSANAKLRNIPVRLLFDAPELNLRAHYSLFDRHTGRPVCVGDGETCKRVTSSGVQTLPCPTPVACPLGVERNCKPYGRLTVRVGEDGGEDELGCFVFRTTGFNSIRTLSTRLSYFRAIAGGSLSTLALELRLRGKSTTQSHRAPIYYVDLTTRTGSTMAETLAQARQVQEERRISGFDQAALDEAAQQGLARGVFEESEEEGKAVVEEFFPETGEETASSHPASNSEQPLAAKLAHKASALQTPTALTKN